MEDMNPYKLLDLIPSQKKWVMGSEDDKKLELRLGLPGGDEEERANWSNKNNKEKERGDGFGGYFGCVTKGDSSNRNKSSQEQKQAYNGGGGGSAASPWGYAKESSQHCYSNMMDFPQGATASASAADLKNKAFSPPPATTAVPNTSQKRAAPAPVVGWPPIRTFRKNLASTNAAKAVLDPPSAAPSTKANEKKTENVHKGLFVKINMDGVPIGRKVDLSAYDSYEKLSSAIDGLFRGLLAARNDSSACGTKNKQEEKAITGLLDGSGEYILVYEDNEGDRMLAGDVPWHMFVSTVKRLRVLKSSELSKLNRVEGRVRKLTNE